MDLVSKALAAYAREVSEVAASPGSTEATFYPGIERLLSAVLHAGQLPFDVRVNTSQRRSAGGTDLPDLAFYDGAGDFVVVFGEVKTPAVEIADLALSTGHDDQIGRYLAQTGVVLLTNVRSFGLLAADPAFEDDGPVPPEHRLILDSVDLWPSASAFTRGRPPDLEATHALTDLVETAVTEFAPIAEPKTLARILARQAKRAKAGLPRKFTSAVQPLLEDFAEALGLTFEGTEGEEFLRSSLIQTAFYGLFASWALWHHSKERRPFHWRDLGEYLKIPFLGALFHEFRNPVRLNELGLAPHMDRATDTLRRVDKERFFRRFVLPPVMTGDGADESATAHAILYFYEPFLEAFDPDLRKELGVWYTPQEIVRYQVRKVDRLLRDELDCPRGFADDRVVVLDPCCGTGAYLIEVLCCVREQLQAEGAGAALPGKILDAFCHRIIGFEILTAPFVVAQLQLYLILSELGVEPDESHRPAIFLTNALTGWDGPEQLKLRFPELQQEHDAAQRVKREEKIIVILGNPPYNRFVGAPVEEEQELADHYKGIQRDAKGRQVDQSELYRRFGIRKHLLDDLYVRFFRLAEIRIGDQAEYGVVSWISNSSYLAGRSHPLMRESLLKNFHTIWIDNLHGNRLASERTPWGDSCETIFNVEGGGPGIKVGACVSTMLKCRKPKSPADATNVLVRDFWGRAHLKRQALLTALRLDELPGDELRRLAERPEGPREFEPVTPTANNRWKLVRAGSSGGFEDWPALDELFPHRFQGVNPARGLDGSVVDADRDALANRMQEYFSDLPLDVVSRLHPILLTKRARYNPEQVRSYLQRTSAFNPGQLVPYLLFPMDRRFLYYETEAKLLTERSPKLWENLQDNLFLVALPQPRRASEAKPLVASSLFDYHLHDHGSFGLPVHVRPQSQRGGLFSNDLLGDQESRANLHPAVWHGLKLAWSLDGELGSAEARRIVLDLFHFTLAIAHAPQYQLDHKDSLANDWLHLPIPKDPQAFHEIARLGSQVGTLLDPMTEATRILSDLLGAERRTLAVPGTRKQAIRDEDLVVSISYFAAARGGWDERPRREDEASHPAWGETTGDLYLNDTTHLTNVPEGVWRYELGGYPVIKKWLGYRDEKRRPGRPLTHEEFDHLRGIVHRIAALLLLQDRLDAAYDQAIADAFSAEELGI